LQIFAIETEERKERITAGNKVFYANKKMVFSKLLTRSSKVLIYKSLIWPVTYGCETRVLIAIHEQPRVFERKVMRKVYGPIKWSLRILCFVDCIPVQSCK
jgi:hypothetical protein